MLNDAAPVEPEVTTAEVAVANTVGVPEINQRLAPGTGFPAASNTTAVTTPALLEPVLITGVTSVAVTEAAAP